MREIIFVVKYALLEVCSKIAKKIVESEASEISIDVDLHKLFVVLQLYYLIQSISSELIKSLSL